MLGTYVDFDDNGRLVGIQTRHGELAPQLPEISVNLLKHQSDIKSATSSTVTWTLISTWEINKAGYTPWFRLK